MNTDEFFSPDDGQGRAGAIRVVRDVGRFAAVDRARRGGTCRVLG